MEAKFFKDYRHNYMILQCEQEKFTASYICKMLTSDKMKKILNCSVRYINGMAYLYYEISSCTTLLHFFQNKKMNYEQVRELFLQLHGMFMELNTYFMDEGRLVLLPEFLYYNITDKQYRGVFYPDYERSDHPYEPLMEFLLNHIDAQDRKLADCVYQIYEMSEEPCFSLEEAIRLLEKREETKQETIDIMPTEYLEEIKSIETEKESFPEGENAELISDKAEGLSAFHVILTVLALLGIGGAAAVGYLYQLTDREQMLLWACMAIMGGCLIFGLTHMKKKGKAVQPETKKNTEEDFTYEPKEISLGDIIDTGLNMEREKHNYGSCHKDDEGMSGAGMREEYNNTVFFDKSAMAEHKLYALDKKNKKHIELTNFPYTIGKMAGCVDMVLADDSVSRIHAKFDRQGNTILLTDMNSTNGTFKNGLRMQPQETVEIEVGDEIRFGTLNYCYR